jgi:hypothetical protein
VELLAGMWENRSTLRVLRGKPEGMRPLGRPRHRWEINIEMYLQEIFWDGVYGINLAEDRDNWRAVLSIVKNYRVP